MRRATVLIVLGVLLLLPGLVGAQNSPGHGLAWHVFTAGGAAAPSGGHRLNGTLGQFAIGRTGGADHTP